MALFKTIEEVQAVQPTLSSSEFDNILPFIKQAELDFIIPAISKEQYDNLSAWYNTATPTDDAENEALLEKVQAALALYAYYLWIDSGQLQIGDSGIRIATTDTLKTAFQWQIDALKISVLNQAGSATDHLLDFMETNKDDYDLWSASESYTEFKDCFIVSAKDFTKIYGKLGGSRLNFLAIVGQMKKVEDFILEAELSPAFYAELREQYLDDDLSTENALLIPMIKKALAHLTMAEAFTQLVVSISENGVLNFNTTAGRINSKQNLPAKDQQITKLELQARLDGATYLRKLKDFLRTNIADYPTYAASDAYDSATGDTAFTNDDTQTGWVGML
jgi:hypothetical protein